MPKPKYAIAVLISGGGSNFIAIHKAIQNGLFDGEIVFVLSSTEKAGGLKYATENEIPHFTPTADVFMSEQKFANYLLEKTTDYNVQLVVLAGFLKKFRQRS